MSPMLHGYGDWVVCPNIEIVFDSFCVNVLFPICELETCDKLVNFYERVATMKVEAELE